MGLGTSRYDLVPLQQYLFIYMVVIIRPQRHYHHNHWIKAIFVILIKCLFVSPAFPVCIFHISKCMYFAGNSLFIMLVVNVTYSISIWSENLLDFWFVTLNKCAFSPMGVSYFLPFTRRMC